MAAIKPSRQIPRFPCPFHGFALHTNFGAMLDTEGNQCALNQGGVAPCQMELARQSPDWVACPRYNPDQLTSMADEVTVFPREAHVPRSSDQPGLPLEEWTTYVMDPRRTRPRWRKRWI